MSLTTENLHLKNQFNSISALKNSAPEGEIMQNGEEIRDRRHSEALRTFEVELAAATVNF